MRERLKLKRGLSDISPLFTKVERLPRPLSICEPEQPVTAARKFSSYPEIIFSWSADDETDAHFLNNYFASKLVSPLAPGLLITVGGETKNKSGGSQSDFGNRSLRHIGLPAAQISEAFSLVPVNSSDEIGVGLGARVFLEMKMSVLLRNPDLIKSLDRVVLFMHPQVDSITETYRKLKKLAAYGLSADISIVFDADDAAGLPARVYELFSDFVSKRLSLNTNYLGTLHLSRGGDAGLSQDLRWTTWNEDGAGRKVSLEKLRFLAWIEKMQGMELCR